MQLDELRSMGWGKPGGRLLVHKVHVGGDGMGTDGRTTHAGPRSSGRTVPCHLGCRADDDIQARGWESGRAWSGRAESRVGEQRGHPTPIYVCLHATCTPTLIHACMYEYLSVPRTPT